MNDLLIIGAGGHGRVVAEAAEQCEEWDAIAFLDDRSDVNEVLGHRIIGMMDEYEKFLGKYKHATACIGDNEKRLELIQKLLKVGYKVPVIIHPKAAVSKYCEIGEGSVILAGAVINTGAKIGRGCIINIGSCVDHDCIISDGVHICSGAVARSACRIGGLSYIGARALVKPGVILQEKFILSDGTVI